MAAIGGQNREESNPSLYPRRLLALPLAGLAYLGDVALFVGRCLTRMGKAPFYPAEVVRYAQFVGFGSLFIVLLTGLFTGCIFSLQSARAFSRVGMESLVGASVLLAVTRELGPVLTALMVTGRVGSAFATELGTMRVTEQLDAMEVMGVCPLRYLIIPRLLATALMAPCLTMLFNAMAAIGTYGVCIWLLQIDEGAYFHRIQGYIDSADIVTGLVKALVFGFILAVIACYQGFHTEGGARGVGQATTHTVVVSSIAIFVFDYLMTVFFLNVMRVI